MLGGLGGQVSFSTFAEWRSFVLVVRKFERAQKLYVLTWLDFDLINDGSRTRPYASIRGSGNGASEKIGRREGRERKTESL
jgi:hypothetical protein